MLSGLVLGSVTGFLVGAGLWWLRFRALEPECYIYFRCPECQQKLRIAEAKGGRPGQCPRCRRRWTLPCATRSGVPT